MHSTFPIVHSVCHSHKYAVSRPCFRHSGLDRKAVDLEWGINGNTYPAVPFCTEKLRGRLLEFLGVVTLNFELEDK